MLKTVWETVSAPFFSLNLLFGTAVALRIAMNAEMHQSITERQPMNEQKYNNRKTYDTPIPKPSDDMFDNFLRNMEDRLVTRRFQVDRGRKVKPMSGRSESR